MVYAEVFERAQQPDYAAGGAYVAYREIARTVRRLKHAGDPATPQVLLEQVHAEAERVKVWCNAKLRTLRRVADGLRHEAVEKRISRTEARDRAHAVKHETLRFHEARCLNADAMLRVAERFRAYTLLPPPPVWDQIRDGAGILDGPLDKIWYCLQAVFSYARGDDAGHSKVGEATGGSQDFVRRSVKYWVHKQDLPFVISKIVQNLPLSAFKDSYDADEDAPYSLGSAISSVYFDNAQFGMYHRRMRRLEGSSLFRIRWYGDERDIEDPTREVFAELKVHHEAWSGEASTKRRFNLPNKDVDAFLVGDLSLNGHVDKLRKRGASDKEVRKFKGLAVEMLTTIVAERLRPAVRTEYIRSAFQRGADQSVRVSIDTDLRMRAEDLGASKHWLSTDAAVDPRHRVDFPYAVVEVKLQCAENEKVPAWVEDLMTCRFMEGVPKFSKYAHGISSLFGASNAIRLTPYWLHQLETDIRAAAKVESDGFDAVRGLAVGNAQRAIDRAIFGLAAPQARRTDIVAALAQPLTANQLMHLYVGMEQGEGALPTNAQFAACATPLHVRHRVYDELRVWKVQQQSASNSDDPFCLGGGEDEAAGDAAFGEIPGQTAKRIKVPQRFDPKTFFTAERYFLRWCESATMLALGALFVIRFGDAGTLPLGGAFYASRAHTTIGVTMMGVAIAALAYALIQYHARSRRVYARVKIRFDDEWGPMGLTFATIFGLTIIAAMHVFERFGHLRLL